MRVHTLVFLLGVAAHAGFARDLHTADNVPAFEAPRTHAARFVAGPERTAVADPGEVTELAAGDLDADGIPDLVCGRSVGPKHALSVHFGNVDALFPNTPEARGRRSAGVGHAGPFHEQALVFEVPARPDFLALGDFDADGDLDAVVAERGRASLWLLAGDGRGSFGSAEVRVLAGPVTAIASGEVNRPDGLADLVVGIRPEAGPAILVFEGPNGAMRADAEVIALDLAATALALGQVHGDYTREVVVTAGTELVVVQGRDRRLVALDQRTDAPAVERIALSHASVDVAVGNFAWQDKLHPGIALLSADGHVKLLHRDEGAVPSWTTASEALVVDPAGSVAGSSLLLARTTGSTAADVLVVDRAGRQLRSLGGTLLAFTEPPVAVLPMRLNGDALADFVIGSGSSDLATVTSTSQATITVNSSGDNSAAGNGACTLREAIRNANTDTDTTGGDCAAGAGADEIAFAITVGGTPPTISLNSTLPAILGSVVIDGGTQGCPAPPCIVLRGTPSVIGDALTLAGGSSTLRGLVIQFFASRGIVIQSAGNFVEGCFVGTDAAGAAAASNMGGGLYVQGPDNTIGGTTPAARNVVSGNGQPSVQKQGVRIEGAGASGNRVLGNYLGTDFTGTAAIANHGPGILTAGADTVVGGTEPGAGNVVVRGTHRGISMEGTGGLVQANRVGTNADGTSAITEDFGGSGISVLSAGTTVGGTTPAARNLSVGGFAGVAINNTTDVFVLGNYLGTDVTGTIGFQNSYGVRISGGTGHVVGGAVEGARNLLSGNEVAGVLIVGTPQGVQVLGNFIGTDVTGTAALPNSRGMDIDESEGTIVRGNLVSGNTGTGIDLAYQPDFAVIAGNLVGTDLTGTLPLGNGTKGISVLGGNSVTIGGTQPEDRNVIAANGTDGVVIHSNSNFVSQDNDVLGNYIGTDITGTQDLGNDGHGIRIQNSVGNDIGGREPGAGNLVRWNGQSGVAVIVVDQATDGNAILGNTLLDNGLQPIDLGADGVTPNDPGDPDMGPNLLQNYPVLTTAQATPASVTITGTLDSSPGTTFDLDFYTGPPCQDLPSGGAERFLGSVSVSTDGSGAAAFNAVLAVPVSDGDSIVATTTAPSDSTSELSACVALVCLEMASMGATVVAEDPHTLSWGDPADVRWVRGDLADLSVYGTLADGTAFAASGLDISADAPAAGQCLYYVVRPLGCGSWQSSPGAEPDRDIAWP